jgi:SPP1 gp7 family putative phage head morphogenesis protein
MWHITQPAAALVPRAVVRKQVPDAEIAVYLAALARLEDPAVAGLIRVLEGMVPSTGALSTQLGLIASGGAPLASAMDMVDWDTFIPALTQALDANQLAAFQAGVAMAGQQAGIVMDVVPGAMQATIDSHAAQAALRGSGLVREITSDQRALINGIVTQGMTRQASVGTMARQLRGGIGLTQRQAGAVGNFGDALERYAAGDMSLDAVRSQYQLARGIRIPAKGLTPARINQLTQAYRDRWVKHRATTIARTETMHALHAGKMAQWDAMRKEGLLPKGLVLEWIVTPDERTCQICFPAHGEQVQAGDIFSTGVERPPAHPMCRCDVRQVRTGSRKQPAQAPPANAIARQLPIAVPPAPGRRPGFNSVDEYVLARENVSSAVRARQRRLEADPNLQRSAGDNLLHELQARQGFSEKPKLVPKAEFDAMLARGEVKGELFRGVRGDEFTEAYLRGEHFAGEGVFGNGTYASTHLRTAFVYSGADQTVMRMGLQAEAQVIGLRELKPLFKAVCDLKNKLIADNPNWLHDTVLKQQIEAMSDLGNPGRLATVLGYDGIRVPISFMEDNIVILNRSRVVAQETLMDNATNIWGAGT